MPIRHQGEPRSLCRLDPDPSNRARQLGRLSDLAARARQGASARAGERRHHPLRDVHLPRRDGPRGQKTLHQGRSTVSRQTDAREDAPRRLRAGGVPQTPYRGAVMGEGREPRRARLSKIRLIGPMIEPRVHPHPALPRPRWGMHRPRRDRQRRHASFETRPAGAPQDDGNLYVATLSYRHPEEARSAVSKDALRPVRDRERFRQDI